MSKKIKFTFNPDGWNIKIQYRSKDRMKFQLKLNKEEAEAFKNFSNTVKPDNVDLNDFVRSIFFSGVRALEEQLTKNLVQHMEENKEDYEASGFTFDEEGKLTGLADGPQVGDVEVIE